MADKKFVSSLKTAFTEAAGLTGAAASFALGGLATDGYTVAKSVATALVTPKS